MSDLVERLRTVGIGRNFKIFAVCEEAADRIEALEAALWEILDAHERSDVNEIARAALAPEQEK